MAHKTLIGDTAYEIDGGKALVDGTAYSIDKGKTLVDGTVYEVGFKREPVTITLTVSVVNGSSGVGYIVHNGILYGTTTHSSYESVVVGSGETITLDAFVGDTIICSAAGPKSYIKLGNSTVASNTNEASTYEYKLVGNTKFAISITGQTYGSVATLAITEL